MPPFSPESFVFLSAVQKHKNPEYAKLEFCLWFYTGAKLGF
jgi:hypothetical protein